MSKIEVPRDRWLRPLITPPDGGDLVAYKRASSFGGPLEDLNNIMLWKQRLTAVGVALDPGLVLEIAACGDTDGKEGKKALNKVVTKAFLAAGGEKKADIGTALHALTEQIDRGVTPAFIPTQYQADVDAYRAATEGFVHDFIEQFVVCDTLKAAGTPDRISMVPRDLTFANGITLTAGWRGITDLKTGSVGFPHRFSVQLAIYAHSRGYNPANGNRFSLGDIDQQHALLVHLPAGQGKCELHLLDIASGWAAAHLSPDVTAWRARKDLTSDLVPVLSDANVTVPQEEGAA